MKRSILTQVGPNSSFVVRTHGETRIRQRRRRRWRMRVSPCVRTTKDEFGPTCVRIDLFMVVQKFGGTSVADPTAVRRLIEIVRTARARDGHGPAVVVSAMSGVTDVLLGIASAAGSGAGTEEALTKIEQLRQRHLTAARELAATADQEALATD